MIDIAAHTMEYSGDFIVSSITLTQYSDKYFESYKRIYEQCFHEMRKALELEPIDCCDSRDILLNKANSIFLLVENESFIGSVAIYRNEIDDLIVAKEYQRKGYGQLLLAYAINYLQKNNIAPIILHVADWNKNAIDLYLKNGFSITKTETIKRTE